MREILVCREDDLKEGEVCIANVDSIEIGVYLHRGLYYGYRNKCLHQGGPVCEGAIFSQIEDVIAANGAHCGQRFNDEDPHIVCPWHGYEYHLLTGECAADPALRLERYEIVRKDGGIYVRV